MASKNTSPIARRRTATAPTNMFQRSDPVEDPVAEVVEEPAVRREQKTFHLDSETVILLGKIQLDRWQQTGKKPKLSDLVDEGIRLLATPRGSGTE